MDRKPPAGSIYARIFMEIARGIAAYLCFVGLSTFLSFVFVSAGRSIAKEINIESTVYFAAASLLMPLSYFSMNRTFELWDRAAQRAYPFPDDHSFKFSRGVKTLFTTPTLRSKLVIHLLCMLILLFITPYEFGYRYLVYTLFPFGTDWMRAKLVSAAIMAPVLTFTLIYSKISAHSWWTVGRESSRQQILGTNAPNLHLFLGIIKVFIIYSLSFIVFPAVILMLVTVVLTGFIVSYVVWLVIVGVILFFIALRLTVYSLKRYRAVKRIKRSLKKNGYTISHMKRPISSLIFPRRGKDFTIEKNGKKWDCKLIGTTKKRRPMFISPKGFVTEKKSIGIFGYIFFHILTETDYAFEGENKLVIIAPVPRKVYINYGRTDTAPDDGDGGDRTTIAQLMAAARGGYRTPARGNSLHGPGYKSDVDRGTIKMLDNGDRLGEYKFFSTAGFISAAGVDVLDR